MCPPMFIWMAETVGIDEALILETVNEACKRDKFQEQCKIIRHFLPWEMIEEYILKKI